MSGSSHVADQPARSTRSLEQDVFLAVQRTADALMSGLAELLKPHGISPAQYNVLRILRGAGAGCSGGQPEPASKGLACREIGQRMISQDPDMTRLLDKLESRGLIVRGRDTRDRRMVTTRITASGLDLLKALDQPVLDLHRRQLGHLGEARLGDLQDLLEAVRRSCRNAD